MVKAFTINLPTLMRIHILVYVPGFFGTAGFQDAYFDVRVFYPNAPSYHSMDLPAIYHRYETEKQRQYSQRVKEVEHWAFTSLVFTTIGGSVQHFTGIWQTQFPSAGQTLFSCVSWLHTRLSYAFLCAAVLCIRGSRSSHCHPI